MAARLKRVCIAIFIIVLSFAGCENLSVVELRKTIQDEVAAAALQQSSEILVFVDERETVNGDSLDDFTLTPPGQSRTLTVQVQNLGGADLILEMPEIWPEGDSLFAVTSHPENRILAQNETLEFTVELNAPSEAGDYTASLYIYSNDEDEHSYKLDLNWSAYEVVYQLNNEESDIVTASLPESKLLEPFPPEKLGYIFAGWYSDSNFNTPWDFTTDPVASDLTLYARWVYNPGVPVYYNANGAEGEPPASQWKVPDEDLVLSLTPGGLVKAGHSFSGWNTQADGYGLDYAPGDPYNVNQEVTLYAQWSPRTYTVSFNTSPGSAVDPQSLLYNSRVNVPDDPVLQDWSFAGWYRDSSFNYPWDFVLDMVRDDTVIYARWSNEAFTVSFDSAGGTSVPEQNITYGLTVAEPARPVRLNHSFSGWYTAESGGELWDFTDPVESGDMTLYAHWELIVAGQLVNYTDGITGFNTVQVPGTDMMPLGVDDDISLDSVDPYEISETEVTYRLWAVVGHWADNNGFSGLSSIGTMGDGTDDTLNHPAMGMNFYGALLWCNALTAWCNAKTNSDFELCYEDSEGNPLKDKTPDLMNGNVNVYIRSGADGFRLANQSEWELAARWRTDDTNTVIWADGPPWFTTGDSVSGGLEAVGADASFEDFAWAYNTSGQSAQPVAQLQPNDLGLYDMCGNGFEWIFNANASNNQYVKGGHYFSYGTPGVFDSRYLKIGETYTMQGDDAFYTAVRLARTIF